MYRLPNPSVSYHQVLLLGIGGFHLPLDFGERAGRMKNCEKCQSNRLFKLYAEYGSRGDSYIPSLNLKYEDTLPHIPGVCNGSNVGFTLCLDCGVIQGFKPMSNKDLDIAYKVAEFGDEWEEVIKDKEEDKQPERVAVAPKLSANSPWAKWVK